MIGGRQLRRRKVSEQWRDIGGYEGVYQVSDHGRVRRTGRGRGAKVGRILRPSLSRGYPHVQLYMHQQQDTRRIHRLVAEAFLPNPRGCEDVNHKNGDKADNSVDNLEWCTRSENHRHAFRTGIRKRQVGEDASGAKLMWAEVGKIRDRYATGHYSWRELAELFHVTHTTIGNIVRNRTWRDRRTYEVPAREEMGDE